MGLAISKSAFKMKNKITYSTVPQISSNSQLTQVTNQAWNHQDPQDCKDLTFFLFPSVPKGVKRSEFLPTFEVLVLDLLRARGAQFWGS